MLFQKFEALSLDLLIDFGILSISSNIEQTSNRVHLTKKGSQNELFNLSLDFRSSSF